MVTVMPGWWSTKLQKVFRKPQSLTLAFNLDPNSQILGNVPDHFNSCDRGRGCAVDNPGLACDAFVFRRLLTTNSDLVSEGDARCFHAVSPNSGLQLTKTGLYTF
jgi:hypothetical protein